MIIDVTDTYLSYIPQIWSEVVSKFDECGVFVSILAYDFWWVLWNFVLWWVSELCVWIFVCTQIQLEMSSKFDRVIMLYHYLVLSSGVFATIVDLKWYMLPCYHAPVIACVVVLTLVVVVVVIASHL